MNLSNLYTLTLILAGALLAYLLGDEGIKLLLAGAIGAGLLEGLNAVRKVELNRAIESARALANPRGNTANANNKGGGNANDK